MKQSSRFYTGGLGLIILVGAIVPTPAHAMGKRQLDLTCGSRVRMEETVHERHIVLRAAELKKALYVSSDWYYYDSGLWCGTGNKGKTYKERVDDAYTDFDRRVSKIVQNNYASSLAVARTDISCELLTFQGVLWQTRQDCREYANDWNLHIYLNFENAELTYRCHRDVPRAVDEIRKEFCDKSLTCALAQTDASFRNGIMKERQLYCTGDLKSLLGIETEESQSARSTQANLIKVIPVDPGSIGSATRETTTPSHTAPAR